MQLAPLQRAKDPQRERDMPDALGPQPRAGAGEPEDRRARQRRQELHHLGYGLGTTSRFTHAV
jgi:hypothetical protein